MAKDRIKAMVGRSGRMRKEGTKKSVFQVWKLMCQLAKAYKQIDQKDGNRLQPEKIIIKQQLEVYDGTMDVWTSMRRQVVDWAYSLYCQCNNYLDPSKQ